MRFSYVKAVRNISNFVRLLPVGEPGGVNVEEHVEEERRDLVEWKLLPELKGLFCTVAGSTVAELRDEYSEPLFPKGLAS